MRVTSPQSRTIRRLADLLSSRAATVNVALNVGCCGPLQPCCTLLHSVASVSHPVAQTARFVAQF
jgi:hypothetical protein